MLKRLVPLICTAGLLGGGVLSIAGPAAAIAPQLPPQQRYVSYLYADYLTPSVPSWEPAACIGGFANPACRQADASGLTYYTGELGLATTTIPPAASAMNTVSSQFLSSAEYRNDLVTWDFNCYLGRVGDATGVAYWDALKGVTTNSLAEAMLSSSEAFTSSASANLASSTPGCSTMGVTLGESNFDTWLTYVYAVLLNRTPDASGRSYYDKQYISGVSLAAIVTSLVNSTEYETDQITSYYEHFLRRGGDAAGVAYYLGLMANGKGSTPEQVQAMITSSAEYWTFAETLFA